MAEELSLAERAIIERNRQKALLKLERKRRNTRLSDKELLSNGSIYIDSNAGYLVDKELESKRYKSYNVVKSAESSSDRTDLICDMCSQEFAGSYLMKNFDLMVCNKCRDPQSHKLINKTSAKEIYLLNDTDLNKRKPVLKFIVKPNPKNETWGDMKLYLEAQVAERSLEIWGSEDALETERKARQENIDKMKILKYQRNIRKMRDNIKAKEMKFDFKGHEHSYVDDGVYNDQEDNYRRTCAECGYVECYELM